MSPDDIANEVTERLMAHCDAPPPDHQFIAALGNRLQAELRNKGPVVNDAQPIERANRIVAAIVVATAAGLLLAFCGAAGVWLLWSSRQSPSPMAHDPPREVTPTSPTSPAVSEQVADNASPASPPADPSRAGDVPSQRPGMPVAEGLTGRPRVEPQADRASLPATPRYGWEPGKTYTYTFSIEGKIGEGTQRTTGRVTYRAADPATQFRVAPATEKATGSGFVVTREGHMVTCAHVVRGATRVDVRLQGRSYPATILALDRRHDLALIKIEAGGFSPLSLGDSGSVELAQDVRVVGYPLTDVLGSSIKITRGTVAGFVNQDHDRLFQVDAPINAGNSGGPVVNGRGEVVGVASAKLSGEEISNVGFAIPVAEVAALLQRQNVPFQAARGGSELDGPELARRVTPAVGLVEVTIGPSGYGVERQTLLTYDASLTTTEPASAPAPRRGPFGPIGPPPIIDPFSRMRGVRPQSEHGQFRADVVGETYGEDMELNLPFLLGPAALLAVEPLGEEGESAWFRQRTISILRTEEEQSGLPFGPFAHHPRFFGHPFGPDKPREKVTAVTSAFEKFDYELGAVSEETIEIKKRYNLKTLDEQADPKFTVKGEGTVLFDRRAGVPRSMEFDARFELQAENVTLNIPVKFTYQQEELSPPAEPSAAVASPTPPALPKESNLTSEQIDDLLKRLASGEQFVVLGALSELKSAVPEPRRNEVAQALGQMLRHKDWPIRQQAAEALAVWCVPENEPALLEALRDNNFAVRGGAIRALASLASNAAAEGVVEVYADNAHEAKAALMKMGSIAEDAVHRLAQSDHWAHRADACEILGQIGTANSLETLREATSDSNGLVQMRAKNALTEVEQRLGSLPPSPEQQLAALRARYDGPAPVDSSERPVTDDTPLRAGQILQVRDNGAWYPVDVLEVLPDGRVRVHYRGWNTAWDKVVARSELQLAHEGIESPAQASPLASATPAASASTATAARATANRAPENPFETPPARRPDSAAASPGANRSDARTVPENPFTPPAGGSSPEEVLRAFLLALTMVDREQGRTYLLEGTDAETLWQATPPPSLARPGIEQWLKDLALRRLTVGEQLSLPDGRRLVISERHVNDGRVMLTWPDNQVPFILVKTPQGWRVDGRSAALARHAQPAR